MHEHASINRHYRLVWSQVHSCWVAVAEGSRGRCKGAARSVAAALIGAVLPGAALAALPGPAGIDPPQLPALPAGAQVVAGQASVTTAGNQLTVYQGTDKAILNWQSFDIGAGAAVRFVQPSNNAVALNRVLGADPSRIDGQLSSNGKVFLVNPGGVLFGAGSRVDVGGLVASSLALPDGEFLAGRYTFSGSAGAGAVRNAGSIRTADGGYVALLAPSVSNSGSIAAPNGSVALAAAGQVAVDVHGDGLVTLRVDRGALEALVNNSGAIQADGGSVELTARGADALARATVNNEGLVQARGLVSDGGRIRLAGDGEVHSGQLDASSTLGRGGQVRVEGTFVALDGDIDAGGLEGGSIAVDAGTTLSSAAASSTVGRLGAGGAVSYRSGGTLVGSGSAAVDASGVLQGGSIGVHGDGGVLSSGSYSARASAGAGGRIDVSGQDVRLLGAQFDATGTTQGGRVRVGGAFQGGAVRDDAPDLARFVTRWGEGAPIANAAETFINDSSAIKVGALGSAGQGGTAVVWSDQQTTMLGSIDAHGAGAAGTVEISSKNELRHVGLERIDLGAGGQLLLDPKTITIASAAGAWTYGAILGKGYSGGNALGVGLDQFDGFGFAVALNAAGNRMVVGAPGDEGFNNASPVSARGAVHLFSFTDNNFSGAALQGTIGSGYSGGKNLNIPLADGAQFGTSVALNAAATRLAVGALGGAGAVHLIGFGDGQFTAPALSHSLGTAHGTANLQRAIGFGASVALNATGDRLAIGALNDSGAAGACTNCGAVYLFTSAVANPTFLKAIGAGYGVNLALASDAQFGTSVAFDGSGDRLAVGAYGINGARGAVYLFNNTFGSTGHVATLGSGYVGGKNLDVVLGAVEGFGSSLALNTAGTRLAVGATGAGSAGNVRIIDFSDNQFSAPTIRATLGSGNTDGPAADGGLEAGEHFGWSLALNGAGDRLVVGSPLSDGNLSDNGGYGTVRAFGRIAPPAANLGFSMSSSSARTVDAGMLASMLDSGTSITLQANNDITLSAGNPITLLDDSGNGELKLQAGRSIILHSSITTGNANLTLVANETAANGVVSANRDTGAAVITTASGTTLNAGSGHVSITIADGAGKANRDSGAITLGGSLRAGSVSVKNRGPTANSHIVIGPAGSITGTGTGLIEIAATSSGGNFNNNAGAAGLNPGAGRYLVYSTNPGTTTEGVSGYNKHYNQAYTGSVPSYAASGNWFLYSVAPTLSVTAAAASKTYDGSMGLPALAFNATGFIDGDTAAVLSGSLSVSSLTKNTGTYAIDAGNLANALGYAITYTGANLTVSPRVLNATFTGISKTYDGTLAASVHAGDDRVTGDALTISRSAAFADRNAGSAKLVNVSGIALGGADAANYQLASTTGSASASIFARVLNASATGVDKTYDGTAAASVTWHDDRIGGDLLQFTGSASFADKQAGAGKAVTVSGIGLTGPDAGNYALASNTAATNASIAQRTLSATAHGVDKTYDGSSAATVTFSDDRIAGDVLGYTGSAAFSDKQAGAGKAIRVTGLALGGLDAANYVLTSTDAATSASIGKRTLAASASGVDKIYDGGTSATVTFGDDRVVGDLLALTGSASFLDKNAGNGKAIGISGIALGGLDAANYTLASTSAATSASIGQRTLVASASGVDKTYDGGTNAMVTFGDDRVAGDLLALTGSASFLDKHAGAGKAIAVAGVMLEGADAGNYTLASTSLSTQADIARRALAASATGIDKVYDGSTAATVTFGDDRVAGDQLNLTGNASFGDRNAGSGKLVGVSSIALDGLDAANYSLASTVASASAAITPRALAVSVATLDKVYDGSTAATVLFGDDRVAGDLLALGGTASFSDRNAGSGKLVSVTGIALSGADAANYRLSSTGAATSASIGQRTLAASASGVDKTYDGGTSASVTFGDDRIAGDLLALTGSASFLDKHAGAGKAIAVAGLTLGGADAGNYTLASTSVSTEADIARRTLVASASGVDKVYDGSAATAVTFGDDRVAGDQLNLTGNASFADRNAGSNKLVSVSGIALDGLDAANYRLASTDAATSASIGQRTLAASASGVDKTYDGGTSALVTFGDDRIAGDLLALTGSASFLDKHAGAGKAIEVSGITLSGLDAGNYTLASTSLSTQADIARRALAASATGIDKVYDGSKAAAVTFGDDRIAGDLLALTGSASFLDKHAGAGKVIVVSGVTLGGADAGNYTLASTSVSTEADIARRTLVASASGVDKVYDGSAAATVNFGDDRVAGDELSLTGTASFADRNAGAGKTVTVSGLVLSGPDAANYTLAATAGSATAAITPRELAVSASSVDKVYDGGTAASVTLADDRVAGDILDLAHAGAAFGDRNVGAGKAIAVHGLALGGRDAANYRLASTASAASAAITPRTLAVAATGVDKVYDGRLDAAVVLADDRVAGDLLDIAASASFLDQHAGAAKTVTLDGLALSGLDAGNYRLAPGPVPAQAAITPRVLAASLSGPVAKTYDGGSGITLAAGQVVLGGFVAGEGANVAAIEASFDSARVLQARSVSAALPAASVAAAAGTRLANYLLPATVSGAGTIHARALTVTGMRAATKVYDGTTSASLLDIGTLDGLVAGESLQLSGPDSVAFATRGAGSGKLVTATGYRIADGATGLASNYALVPTASTSDSVVKQATLTVRANDASRVAGALNPEFTYSFSGLAAGDSPAILPEMTASTAANAASAAGSYAITVGTRVDTDTVLPDYRLAFLDGVLTVTAAPAPAPAPAPPAPPVPEPAPAPLPAPAVPEPVLLGALQEVRTEEDRRPHAAPVLVESAGEVCLPPQGAEASVLTLSGGTEVLTVDGGIRTTE